MTIAMLLPGDWPEGWREWAAQEYSGFIANELNKTGLVILPGIDYPKGEENESK